MQLIRLIRPMRAVSTLVALLLVLSACSPTYNWREVHQAPELRGDFSVLLPAKAARYSRPVDLGGPRVDMHMTAAETDGITFAVATAELADATTANAALDAMRQALLANIGARPAAGAVLALPGKTDGSARTIDVDASGTSGGRARRLVARLVARDKRVFQVMMMGDERSFTADNIETFFGSFKPT